MFVRFRKYKLSKGGNALRVELVKSFSDPSKGGEPRNRFIAYLGSIREQDYSNPVEQVKFWRSVKAELAQLCLSTDDENRIREKVQARIPHKSWSDIIAHLSRVSPRSIGR